MLNTFEVFIHSLPNWSFSFSKILDATLIAVDNIDSIIQFTCNSLLWWKVNAFENLFEKKLLIYSFM